jgi:hypothetical protein
MDTQRIRRQLADLVNQARGLADSYAGLSVAMRYADTREVRDLLATDGGGGADGIEATAQRVRVELAGLDRALALFREEAVARLRELQRDADANAAGGGGATGGGNN